MTQGACQSQALVLRKAQEKGPPGAGVLLFKSLDPPYFDQFVPSLKMLFFWGVEPWAEKI